MTCRDDGIVFLMEKKITVDEYFTYPESNRPMELVYGYVREPAMPSFGHETIVLRIAELLTPHVRERALGKVGRADVVLDSRRLRTGHARSVHRHGAYPVEGASGLRCASE
jgi:hypothetical protein